MVVTWVHQPQPRVRCVGVCWPPHTRHSPKQTGTSQYGNHTATNQPLCQHITSGDDVYTIAIGNTRLGMRVRKQEGGLGKVDRPPKDAPVQPPKALV